jgi:hypothetical protein
MKSDGFDRQNSGISSHGIRVYSHTGCAHYRSAVNLVAIKFAGGTKLRHARTLLNRVSAALNHG